MKKLFFASIFVLLGCSSKKAERYVPDSNGNLNHVTVVMSNAQWNGGLGELVRKEIASEYEGLPMNEPRFSLKQLHPKNFDGFARNSRNILWFKKDSIARFELIQNPYARPQIVASFRGEDEEIMKEYVRENKQLIQGLFQENERKEKLRRIRKALSKDYSLENRFNFSLSYPSAYKTVKDTVNFIWIEKQIHKGTLNLIAYTLPLKEFSSNPMNDIVKIRDSIGELYVPGRLPGSHMITEEAYLPYLYKTTLDDKEAFLTKGMWEVKKDFMAGPFVNYMLKDQLNKKWIVVEGFAFAPSVSKRDYMFELNTIISTFSQAIKKEN